MTDKFRYYITDLYEGAVSGTNDEAVARDLSKCEDYFVIDTETNSWLVSGGEGVTVQEVDAKRLLGE